MKIGIVFKPYAKEGEPFRGGMGNFAHLLSKNLAERGHDVTVLAGKNSKFSKGVKLFKPRFEEKDMNVYHAWESFYDEVEKECKTKRDVVNKSFGELSARFDRKIESYLSFFAYAHYKKFDIIHTVTHDILANYSALFSSMPTVISFHGHYEMLGPDFLDWLKFMKKYDKPDNATLVSVSKYIQKEYGKYVDTKLIYNAIETEKFTPKYKKENYVAWLGRIDYHKGLDFALDFSEKYKIPLKIGARIDDPYTWKNLEKRIDGKLIQYIGHLNEKQKNKLLANAKVFLMTSRYKEAFGRVTAESLACGTPVIAFNKGANPELVINGKTGYLIKENDLTGAKKAYDKIENVDPKYCRKFVEKNFDIKRQIDEYEGLYKKIIK